MCSVRDLFIGKSPIPEGTTRERILDRKKKGWIRSSMDQLPSGDQREFPLRNESKLEFFE